MAGGSALGVVDVGVSFGGLTALSQVSLDVADSGIVGVIGPNGAGKTTLFNVICGFVRPSAGHLSYWGHQLRMKPNKLSRLGISRTLQGVGLFKGLTVVENVMAGASAGHWAGFGSALLGMPMSSRADRTARKRAIELLEEAGIDEHADSPPQVLPYAIQKRAALARALMNDPRMLLLDEPASGLSEDEMADLGDRLHQLGERMGIMLVEHHMDLVMSVCERIVVLDFGQVIATGPPDEVKANPAVTTAYLGQEVTEEQAGVGPVSFQ